MPKGNVQETNLFYIVGEEGQERRYPQASSLYNQLNGHSRENSIERYGDKLQQFLDDNDLDLDLRTGEGEDRLCLYIDYDHQARADRRPFCALGEVNLEEMAMGTLEQSQKNSAAMLGLRKAIGYSPLTSTLYVYKKGETSPSIVYFDEATNSIKATEPVDRLDVQSMKPHKPGLWARFWHAVNKNLYSEVFERYESDMETYNAFAGEHGTLQTTKEAFAAETEHRTQEAQQRAQEARDREALDKSRRQLMEAPAQYKAYQERTNGIIDDLLGPKAEGSKALLDAEVYHADKYTPEKLDYPQTQFTDHEIALLGYAAISQPDIACRREAELGLDLTQEEMAKRNITHYTDDIFFTEAGGKGRAGGDTTIAQFNDVRKKVRDALQSYSEGNKQPLAKILGDSVRMQVFQFKSASTYSVKDVHMAEILQDTLAVLNKDPELMPLSGLKPEELTAANGLARYAEINKNAISSAAVLADSSKELTSEQKQELLGDVILAEAVDAVNFAEYKAGEKAAEEKNGAELVRVQQDIAARVIPPEKSTTAIDTALAKQHIALGDRDTTILKTIGKDMANHSAEKKYKQKLQESPAVQAMKELSSDALVGKIAGGFVSESKELMEKMAPEEPKAAPRERATMREKENRKTMDVPGLGRKTIG